MKINEQWEELMTFSLFPDSPIVLFVYYFMFFLFNTVNPIPPKAISANIMYISLLLSSPVCGESISADVSGLYIFLGV